jgi:uncharacterized protein YggE
MPRRHALVAALAAAVPLAACAHPPPSIVVHASGERSNALTTTGSATLAVVPDCADLTLTVGTDARRPGDALAAARAREDALVAALHARGVKDTDLALSHLGVDPVYHYDDGRNIFDGFHAHVTVTATTRAFGQIGPLLEAAADAGVTEMSTRFRRSDLDAIRALVRARALAAAQTKAKDTAAVLGINLGRISAVSDASQSFLYSNEYFPSGGGGGGGGGLGGEEQPLTIAVTLTYDI